MKFILFLFLVTSYIIGNAQPASNGNARAVFHKQIDQAKAILYAIDGVKNTKIPVHHDTDNDVSPITCVDNIQAQIEQNIHLTNNEKIAFLRGLKDVIDECTYQVKTGGIKSSQVDYVLESYDNTLKAIERNESLETLLQDHPLEILAIISKTFPVKQHKEKKAIEYLIVEKTIARNPITGLGKINQYPDYPRTDSLISHIAHQNPEAIYNWVPSGSYISNRIIAHKEDPLVKAIADIARTKQGRMYFPFLNSLYKGTLTIDQIDAALQTPSKYYSLLVKTQIENIINNYNGENVYGKKALEEKLKEKAIETYINVVNALHDSPADVRFASIRKLTPEELYYLIVMSEDVIYTSSYVQESIKDGLYYQIFKNKIKGDELLSKVMLDHFKKWLKIAANYNTLDHFLKTMEPSHAETLMKLFVMNLDKETGENELQDAVDVASSYSSITNPTIKELVLSEVQKNLHKAQATGNKKAFKIYDILNTLFLSMENPNIDLSEKLGIPPVYYMPVKTLQNSTDRIIVQQFFYGDQDGKIFYQNFINSFNKENWKFSQNEYWSEFSTIKGVPITIYTNKPLGKTEGDGEDQKAQDALQQYFEKNNISPTIVIHRGHSYHLQSTIDQLALSAKVVLLGSCGGFQSLNTVLEKCPSAQIISTKQTGTGAINTTLINGILNTLRVGKQLDWVNMWKSFSKEKKGDAQFSDYVPPYQNLGAVFIMAYHKDVQDHN